MNYALFYDVVGLLGLIGFFAFVLIKHPIPKGTPDAGIRCLSIFGLVGLAGLSIHALAVSGALGAFTLWNHPIEPHARLARLGWFGLLWPMILIEGTPL